MTNYEKLAQGNMVLPNSAKALGSSIEAYCSKTGSIEIIFTLGNDYINPTGHIQGGFLCAMLDECMGSAIFYSLEDRCFTPTLELKTQFLRAALPGLLKGTARVVSKGRQICFVEGHLYQQDTLIATSTATVIIKKSR